MDYLVELMRMHCSILLLVGKSQNSAQHAEPDDDMKLVNLFMISPAFLASNMQIAVAYRFLLRMSELPGEKTLREL